MTEHLDRRRDQVVGHAGLAEFADEAAAASPSWFYAQADIRAVICNPLVAFAFSYPFRCGMTRY